MQETGVRREHEAVFTEDQQADHTGTKTGERRRVLLCFFPLVNEDNEKQGCHTEIKARQVKWNDLA